MRFSDLIYIYIYIVYIYMIIYVKNCRVDDDFDVSNGNLHRVFFYDCLGNRCSMFCEGVLM